MVILLVLLTFTALTSVWFCDGAQAGDLAFRKGQRLQLEQCKGEWWTGRILGEGTPDTLTGVARTASIGSPGVFPAAFVARGRAVPAKAPPKAAVPAVPSGGAEPEPAPAATEEGVRSIFALGLLPGPL